MALTSPYLFVLVGVTTVAAPLLLVLALRRTVRAGWLRSAARFAAVLLCQVLAVSTVFLGVNNQYGFYSSWSDLAGRGGGGTAATTINTNNLTAAGSGTVQTVTVKGTASTGGEHQVLIWLPPGYDQQQHDQTRYPVMLVLPGQPSTPESTFDKFDFGTAATAAIASGQVKPFVAVFPPLMTNPPRDTECTDIPGGPQAETWLDHTVYRSIQTHVRTDGTPWTALGYSTGGFCAAKLLLHHPQQFRKAASLGGYYQTLTDHTTGNLFGDDTSVRNHNSPQWLYAHGGLHGRQLLIVTGREDTDSYASSAEFLAASRGDHDVASLIFPTGGHNYRNYSAYVGQSVRWLQSG